jgi:hypothetical protein
MRYAKFIIFKKKRFLGLVKSLRIGIRLNGEDYISVSPKGKFALERNIRENDITRSFIIKTNSVNLSRGKKYLRDRFLERKNINAIQLLMEYINVVNLH